MERHLGMPSTHERRRRELDGFTLPPDSRQAAEVRAKIHRFIQAGPDKIKTVWDFDRTITQGSLANGHDATVLGFVTSLLAPPTQHTLFELSDKYRPLEIQRRLSSEDAQVWWETPLASLEKEGVGREQLGGFKEFAKPRDVLISTFKRLEAAKIPIIISSGGISDVIEIWNKDHDINANKTVSTKLMFNQADKIAGWDKDSLVHVLNKREKTQNTLEQYENERPLTIIFGDSMEDADILEGKENVLRVRVKPHQPNEAEGQKQAYRQETFTKFDLLLEHGDFFPVLLLLNQLTGHPEATIQKPHYPGGLNGYLFDMAA